MPSPSFLKPTITLRMTEGTEMGMHQNRRSVRAGEARHVRSPPADLCDLSGAPASGAVLDAGERDRLACEVDVAACAGLAEPQVQQGAADLCACLRRRPLARPRIVGGLIHVVLQVVERLCRPVLDAFRGGVAVRKQRVKEKSPSPVPLSPPGRNRQQGPTYDFLSPPT